MEGSTPSCVTVTGSPRTEIVAVRGGPPFAVVSHVSVRLPVNVPWLTVSHDAPVSATALHVHAGSTVVTSIVHEPAEADKAIVGGTATVQCRGKSMPVVLSVVVTMTGAPEVTTHVPAGQGRSLNSCVECPEPGEARRKYVPAANPGVA